MIEPSLQFRYNHSEEQEIIINPFDNKDIGIELYSVNIVRNPRELDMSYAKRKMKNKELTRYAIVFTEKLHLESYDRKLENIFNEFWERQILNVIVIFWTDELNCFTYTPFSDPLLIPLNLNETDPKRLFYDKTRNLNGHEIRLGMADDSKRVKIIKTDNKTILRGYDGGFGGMIMKRMNATFKVIQPIDDANLGELFANGSANGIFALLQTNSVDMSFNARFYRMQHFRFAIEPTVTIGRDNLCILVPRSGLSLNLDNIFDTFEWPIWISIIAALPIYALFFQLYHRNRRSFGTSHSLSHTCLRLFGWNLNQPYMSTPKTTLAKLLIGLWITYSAVITNWYNSNLTSYLMTKPRLPDIETLRELEQSNYHILTAERYTKLINEFVIKTNDYENLWGRIHFEPHEHIYKRILSNDLSYAYADKEHVIRYLMLAGRLFETFSQMKECPVPFINVYAMSYGSPYKGRVNWIMSQAIDYGIVDHWLNLGLHRDKLNQFGHHSRHKSHTTSHDSISMSHLQSAFYILLLGCIVSFLVFLGEINRAKHN